MKVDYTRREIYKTCLRLGSSKKLYISRVCYY